MESLHQRFIQLRKQYIESQFQGLNTMQQQAVFSIKGSLLILAGAGSGKTTVLVNRIANMICFGNAHQSQWLPRPATEQDCQILEQSLATKTAVPSELREMLQDEPVRPWNVLAITFTNKAAEELKARLRSMLGATVAEDIHASTFHSCCVRILRRDAEKIGYPQSFTIYDSDDQQRAMKEIYKQLSIDDKMLPLKSCLGAIGRLKDTMLSPDQALQQADNPKTKLITQIYHAYQQKLKQAGAMDFDDLIYNVVRLLENFEDCREYYRNRFRYILVDEYQDTSIAQFRLVHILGCVHQNVCVVGDDDQSIYRFRGATIENILSFEQHFAGAKVIRLEENYRSTANILNAANSVIENNSARKGKTLWTQNPSGEKVQYVQTDTETEEAQLVAVTIGQNLKKGAKLKDHAILYRMNAQSGPVETYFARSGIPYRIIGGQRFYDRKEVKDIISYFSVVANPKDDLRLKRIINEPARKIGNATIDKMQEIANTYQMSMLEVAQRATEFSQLGRAATPLKQFSALIQQLNSLLEQYPLQEFASKLLEVTGYKAMLEQQGEEGAARLENLSQLISSIHVYVEQKQEQATLQNYLEEVALISDLDNYNQDDDRVVMMTMHSAKGLEFPYVFIIGMEEGVFPSEMVKYSPDDLEEERRLCYVGITRAKQQLWLISSKSRMIFGRTQRNRPSRFVEEIDSQFLEGELPEEIPTPPWQTATTGYDIPIHSVWASKGAPAHSASHSQWKKPTAGRQMQKAQTADTGNKTYTVGDRVEHRVWGKGVIVKVTPMAGDMLLEIQFESAGLRKTMANYTPITRL